MLMFTMEDIFESMTEDQGIKEVEQRIEYIRKQIADGHYLDAQDKHNLQKECWLLKKHLEALKAGLDTIIIQ